MKKKTERDEYFYALGHAVALADIYTLLETTVDEDKHEKVMEWMNTLKKLYEEKDLWQDAETKTQGETKNVSNKAYVQR